MSVMVPQKRANKRVRYAFDQSKSVMARGVARGVRFLLGFRVYPFLRKTGPSIPVFGY